MSQEAIETYWKNICSMKSTGELHALLNANTQMGNGALDQIAALVNTCSEMQASIFSRNLLTLGVMIAGASNEAQYLQRFSAPIYLTEALDAIAKGQKEKAIKAAFFSAESGIRVKNENGMLRLVSQPVLLLLRLGAVDKAYAILEQLVSRLESETINCNQLYDIFSVCKYVPATVKWIALFRRLRDGIKRTGNLIISKVADCHLGIFAIRSGDYEAGLVLLLDTEDLMSKSGFVNEDNAVTAMEENFLLFFWKAKALELTGKEDQAEAYYRAYLSNEKNDPQKHAAVVIQLAEQLIDNDKFQEALHLLEQKISADDRYHAYALLLTAFIYNTLNRPALKKYLLMRAAAVLVGDAEPDIPGMGSVLENKVKESQIVWEAVYAETVIDWKIKLATIKCKPGNKNSNAGDSVIASACLAYARNSGERVLEVLSLQVLAKLAFENNDWEEALVFFKQAYDAELSHGNAPGLSHDDATATIELNMLRSRTARIEAGAGIRLLFETGRIKKLLDQDPTDDWNKVITGARIQNKSLLLFSVLSAKAEWLDAIGKTDDAIAYWEESIDILDVLRTEFQDIESQVGILQNKENGFANLLTKAVKNGNDSLVLRLMERAKSRALLETINSRTSGQLSPEMADQAKTVRQALVRAMREELEWPGTNDNEIKLLKERLSTIFSSANKKRQVMKLGGATANDVIEYAKPGIAVIHYFVSEKQVIIAGSVNGKMLTSASVNCSRASLQEMINTLHRELVKLETCNSLSDLYKILILPIESHLRGCNELIIIPHDLLHSVPFQALRNLNGAFLVEHFEIRYVPSIGVALQLQRFGGDNKVLKSWVFAAGQLSYIGLPLLVAVEKETSAILKCIPGGTLFSGLAARRAELLQNKENLGILHLACHGEYDTVDPLLSRLYLGDGPVYGYEIERLQFRSRLVVLSACETGMQHRLAGDETFGLVRAFLSQGSQAILASLWNVSDSATGLLMESFYMNFVEKKKELGNAVRLAQLSLIQSANYHHPFYWSPFMLIGTNFLNR